MSTRKAQRGQILPLVGVCLFVLMTFAAFAIDLGYMRYQQRLQQNAADGAALAAASVYRNPSPAPSGCTYGTGSAENTEATCAADVVAAANGFPSPDVTVTMPPSSGGYTASNDAVEVDVSVPHNTIFSGWLFSGGSPTITVTTRAVALPFGGTGGPCVSSPGSIKMNGGASITAPCGMVMGGTFTSNSGGTSFDIPFIGEATAGGACSSCSTSGTTFENITVYTDPCTGLASCNALMSAVPLNTPANAACAKAQAVITTVVCNSSVSNLSPGTTYVYDTVAPPSTLTCSSCSATSGVTIIVNNSTPNSISWGGTPGAATNAMNAPPLTTSLTSLSNIAAGVTGVSVYITDNGCPGNGDLHWNFNGSGMFYAAGCSNVTLNTSNIAASNFAIGTIKNGNGNLTIIQPALASSGGCTVGCSREPALGE